MRLLPRRKTTTTKEEEDQEREKAKRASSARATDEEERAWMDIMSKQNNSALQYAKKAPPKPKVVLLEDKIIFVVGGPGSGKGTQCARIAEEFNLSHLSVGDLLRAEASKPTERAKLLNEYMKDGKIVPMEITLEVVRAAIQEHKGKAGFLIDGFPRKLDQAKEFEEKVAKCTFVLYFECSEAEMTKRLLVRGQTSGRIDDNEETIKKRLETFRETSMPVVDHFAQSKKVEAINSERDVEEVYGDTRKSFLKYGLVPVNAAAQAS